MDPVKFQPHRLLVIFYKPVVDEFEDQRAKDITRSPQNASRHRQVEQRGLLEAALAILHHRKELRYPRFSVKNCELR